MLLINIKIERCPQNRLLLSRAWLNYVIGVECSNWTTDFPLKIFLVPSLHLEHVPLDLLTSVHSPERYIFDNFYFLSFSRRKKVEFFFFFFFERSIWIIKSSWSIKNKNCWLESRTNRVEFFQKGGKESSHHYSRFWINGRFFLSLKIYWNWIDDLELILNCWTIHSINLGLFKKIGA